MFYYTVTWDHKTSIQQRQPCNSVPQPTVYITWLADNATAAV